jgi:hypothetical protein
MAVHLQFYCLYLVLKVTLTRCVFEAQFSNTKFFAANSAWLFVRVFWCNKPMFKIKDLLSIPLEFCVYTFFNCKLFWSASLGFIIRKFRIRHLTMWKKLFTYFRANCAYDRAPLAGVGSSAGPRCVMGMPDCALPSHDATRACGGGSQ